MHHLSNALREKSGLDGDGGALVGQALGGEFRASEFNSLQTKSERNVQKGMEQILRGLYLGIRNPRSHDHATDSKATADAVIVFVDYLLTVLEAAREAFTRDTFISRVADREFVNSERYAELLIAEIPIMRRGEALVALYEERSRIDLQKSMILIGKLLDGLSDPQTTAYLAVVSEELRSATDDASTRLLANDSAIAHLHRNTQEMTHAAGAPPLIGVLEYFFEWNAVIFSCNDIERLQGRFEL